MRSRCAAGAEPMARLAISKDYFPAYAALPRKAQRKADEFLRKFEQDSAAASIHLERVRSAVDPLLRSARIGDDFRIILRAPEQGDVFLVLWADHHDEAYRWASTKQTAVHPATGTLQIFDTTAAAQALTSEPISLPRSVRDDSPEPPPDLFAARSDDDLFLAGVPRALLPSVRALSTDDDLDRLLPHLPPEAGEVLTALAAGIALDDALEEVLGRTAPPAAAPQPPPVDVTDVPAALARDTTQRQFRLLGDDLDLDAALKHPLDLWRVFLHPKQRRLVRAHTKGPTRVLGGAGTGKTVVAIHRAAFLVREVFTKPDDRVLFTTFTVNLAQDLRTQLAKLLEPDALARVEVVNIDSWASTYLRGRGIAVRPAFEKEQRERFDAAYEVYGRDDVSADFYRAEWRDVIQEQGLRTEDEYVVAVRRSRGVPLGRVERRRLWPVFAAYRDNLEHAGMLAPPDILRRARAELETANAPSRYRSIVVDEAQDFSAEGLRLLRAIAGPEHPDDLFLVGDAHQRIYGRPVALSKCGIQVRGRRSQTLRLNYRTTAAIARWSLDLLKDVVVDDLDEGDADRRGYVSLREGPAPNVHVAGSALEEETMVVATVKAYLEAGAAAETICVVGRTHGLIRDRFQAALDRAGVATVLLEQEEPRLPGVRLATMHRVKGLEFAVVLLVGISKQEVPLSTPELRSDDPIMSSNALLRERSLLYVAASRARDELHVFYAGEPSPLLANLIARPQLRTAPAQATPASPASLEAALATPLISLLDLPQRMVAFADGQRLKTLGDLARHAPQDLLAERNLGRKTILDTRRLIESATGRRWEELAAQPVALLPPASAATAPAPTGLASAASWDAFRGQLSDGQRSFALTDIELPARLRSYAKREGITTLGDLAKRSQLELVAAPNVGRASLAALPRVITQHLESLVADGTAPDDERLESFKGAVEGLDPMLRIIATRRSGLGGDPVTLQELGDMFGVTRERIRQLEAKVCEALGRHPWAKRATVRVAAALEGGAVSFASLARDPWWATACERPAVVEFVVEQVLASDVFVIELDAEYWLSRIKASLVDSARSELLRAAEAIPLPGPFARFEPLIAKAAEGLGPGIAQHLRNELRGRMRFDVRAGESPQDNVLALGDTRNAEILALLRAAPEPLRVGDIQARPGGARVGRFPEEVIHFGRGTVGLRQHFPDFEKWREALVPDAVKLIATLGPERQWHCSELLDELREEHEIPEWLTAFGLAALIKADGRLRYLGRLRVALPGSRDNESRLFVHEALEEILAEAGEPVLRAELLQKLGKRLGASELSLQQVFTRPQFVRIDGERIGLLARDVPGGGAAIAEAGDHVEASLTRRDRGLSEFHVHEEVQGLSPDHAKWTLPLTVSVLRGDGRFRFSTSGAIGLATWESTRVPTRLELVRSALDAADGRVSVEAVLARIEAHYGNRPTRATLIGIAHNIGAGVDAEWILRKGTE